jgi:hypothetical protein
MPAAGGLTVTGVTSGVIVATLIKTPLNSALAMLGAFTSKWARRTGGEKAMGPSCAPVRAYGHSRVDIRHLAGCIATGACQPCWRDWKSLDWKSFAS